MGLGRQIRDQRGRDLTKLPTLTPSHAAAALIQTEDGRYLLQLRDDKPEIFFPNRWGLFGGAIDPGEDALTAVVREVWEELALRIAPERFEYFSAFDFDFGFSGHGMMRRSFYSLQITKEEQAAMVLGEGREIGSLSADEILTAPRIVPYDEFALWLHIQRNRIV